MSVDTYFHIFSAVSILSSPSASISSSSSSPSFFSGFLSYALSRGETTTPSQTDISFAIFEFPSIPIICLYPPCDSTLRRVWAVMQQMSCCSKVMAVWMRMLPPSHGSVIPAEPGKKRPAARSWKTRRKAWLMGRA